MNNIDPDELIKFDLATQDELDEIGGIVGGVTLSQLVSDPATPIKQRKLRKEKHPELLGHPTDE